MLDIKSVSLRTEDKIIAAWNNKEKVVVSVVCATFNHETYIEEAITGFLMQETDFRFEVVIHDDASTDRTTEIIKGYQHKYPSIIKPLYQKENQYSKGRFKPSLYAIKHAVGDFIALCEGDDHWCSSDKLQAQKDVFTRNESCRLCIHPALEVNCATSSSNVICKYAEDIIVVPSGDVIRGRGGYAPTASLMFKCTDIDFLHGVSSGWPIGDFFIQSYLALLGDVFYLPEVHCVYRRGSLGSWTSGQDDSHKQLEYFLKMSHAISEFYGNVEFLSGARVLVDPFLFYSFAYLNRAHENDKLSICFVFMESYKIGGCKSLCSFFRLLARYFCVRLFK